MALPLLLLAAGMTAKTAYNVKEAGRQREARQTGAQNLMAAGGFGGPQAGLDPTQVAGLQDALASDDPLIRQQAFKEMQDYQAELGMQMTPKGALEVEQLRLANERTGLELQAMQNPQTLTDPKFQADIANQLRDERSADLKPYQTQLRLYDDINSLLQPAMQGGMQTGPAAMNILFRYIKGLDDSVVRPSEGEALRGGTGIASQFVSMYNEMLGQGFITPEIAQQMHEAAATVAQQQYTAAQDVVQMHNERAAAFVDEYAFSQNFGRLAGEGMLRERSFNINPTESASGNDDDGVTPQSAEQAIPGFTAD